MGWDFKHAKHYKNGKVDRKAECDAQFTFGTHKILKSSMKGTTYYAAVDDGKGNIFAVVALTAGQDRHDPYFNFGMKSMSEDMHPYFYDCPKGILDLLTETDSENANIWRSKCREKKQSGGWLSKIQIGEKIIWRENKVLTKHAPAYQFKTWFWYDEENHSYIQKKRVTEMNSRPYEEVKI